MTEVKARYQPIYRNRENYEKTRDMSLYDAAALLDCSTGTVSQMRTFFRNVDSGPVPVDTLPLRRQPSKEEFDPTPFQNLLRDFENAILADTEYSIKIAKRAGMLAYNRREH